jgi:hypothetical protein
LSNYALSEDYLNHASLEKYLIQIIFIGFIAVVENKIICFTLIDILSPGKLIGFIIL